MQNSTTNQNKFDSRQEPKDKIIKCQDCGQDFPWTTGEQEFYAQKNLKPPIRCPICRAAFKAAREDKFRGRLDSENGKWKTENSSESRKKKTVF